MMRKWTIVLVLALAGFAGAEPDSLVQAIVGQVSQDSVTATISRLQAFGTRQSQTDSNRAAADYARDRMLSYGCDSVVLQVFDTIYGFGPNVIGTKVGHTHPEVAYIICGHIDSQGTSRDSAPGADDDASGVAAVLEACRVFAPHWFDATVRFFCSNAEESGGQGAMRYAYQARQRGDSIAGVLDFDMIGYGMPGQDSVFLCGKNSGPDCSPLLNRVSAATSEYTALKFRPILSPDTFWGCDQWHFWNNRYQALFIAEVQQTPEIHSRGDTLGPLGFEQCGVNNLPLCTEATKTGVAALAVMAQVEGNSGIAEVPPTSHRSLPGATFIRHVPAGDMFDASGRRVSEPGAGVYFIREHYDGGWRLRRVVVVR